MRGLQKFRTYHKETVRYNPAYAGTTPCDMPSCSATFDTTPRMRGLLAILEEFFDPERYNPAYAGTTWCLSLCPPDSSIQPRVCGDYYAIDHLVFPLFDTTPRMRGLLKERADDCIDVRYNPAYAGTTRNHPTRVMSCQIQPRVCGDYIC